MTSRTLSQLGQFRATVRCIMTPRDQVTIKFQRNPGHMADYGACWQPGSVTPLCSSYHPSLHLPPDFSSPGVSDANQNLPFCPNVVFILSCFHLVLCSWLLVLSFLFLSCSSYTSSYQPGLLGWPIGWPIQHFLSFLWTLPGASGHSLPQIYCKIPLLDHILEWPCPHF